MERVVSVIIYCVENCPKCEQLKRHLRMIGEVFATRDMSHADAITELRCSGVFTLAAPVLQAGGQFYTVDQLFDGDTVREAWKEK